MTTPETNTAPQLSGEDRLRQRRRRIRAMQVGILGLGALFGIAFGLSEGGALRLSPLLWWTLVGLLAVGVVAANLWYMRRVDEVEVMDNLWAAFVGMNAHILIGAGWVAASARGMTPAPDVLSVLMATLIITLITYVGLKLRRRLG
jgi:hypothetical protein